MPTCRHGWRSGCRSIHRRAARRSGRCAWRAFELFSMTPEYTVPKRSRQVRATGRRAHITTNHKSITKPSTFNVLQGFLVPLCYDFDMATLIRRWTKEEDAIFRRWIKAGRLHREIGKRLGRSRTGDQDPRYAVSAPAAVSRAGAPSERGGRAVFNQPMLTGRRRKPVEPPSRKQIAMIAMFSQDGTDTPASDLYSAESLPGGRR